MTIKVLFFGPLTDKVSEASLLLENVQDIDSLKQHLFALYPSLNEVPFSLSVNRKFVHENESLNDGDEVACLPPFSGG